MPPITLEFIIPTYKRYDGALKACNSVLKQIKSFALQDVVSVRVVDDCSPGFDPIRFLADVDTHNVTLSVESHSTNKGMSRNIYYCTHTSRSDYCTILTDDDWLKDYVLGDIINELSSLSASINPGGIVVSRHSYQVDGSLYCVACEYIKDHVIHGRIQSLRNYHSGFILTGFIFRPSILDYDLWSENIDNGYFPILYFSALVSVSEVLCINREWFHHTVLNHCHWEAWGHTDYERSARLYRDYIDSLRCVYLYNRRLARRSLERLILKLLYIFLVFKHFYFNQYGLRTTLSLLSCDSKRDNLIRISYLLWTLPGAIQLMTRALRVNLIRLFNYNPRRFKG